jgi:hypothetical protein
MPATATRLKRTFKDEGRELRFVEDDAAAADIVVTVGAKTKALKP